MTPHHLGYRCARHLAHDAMSVLYALRLTGVQCVAWRASVSAASGNVVRVGVSDGRLCFQLVLCMDEHQRMDESLCITHLVELERRLPKRVELDTLVVLSTRA